MVGDGRPAEGDALGDLADVQLGAGQQLDQVLAHGIGERHKQVAADSQVLAEAADLGVEGGRVDQAAHILIGHQMNALKHVNILGFTMRRVK
jgi:hypothetical protein